MVYKKFTWKIVLLQVLLAITLLIFMYVVFMPGMVITAINLGILSVLEMVYIIYVINKTNRDLARFFDAFRFHESTISFETPNQSSFDPLHKSLDKILQEFHSLNAKIENERFFYLNALNHTSTGIIIADARGSIRFSNRAIQKMADMNTLDNIGQLNKLKTGLSESIIQMTPNSKMLVKAVVNSEIIELSLRCSMFRTGDELYRIISFQDIRYEMESNETEAWQKLIRILTHEIMNSVSPITLTAAGIIQMLEKERDCQEGQMDNKALWDEVIRGLEAIRKRSKGLASFVENYHSVNQLPQPVLSLIPVKDLFTQIGILMKEDLQKKGVKLEVSVVPESLLLHADEKLLGQALINLLQNSIFALENKRDKKIMLMAFQINDQVRISITDNGKGIPPELLDSVFVPFFTTRERGSGIGLSLSREIMKIHGGGIRVHSEPGKGTTFTLLFS